MVIDGHVQELIASTAALPQAAAGEAVSGPPETRQALDIEVHQFARMRMLVAHHRWLWGRALRVASHRAPWRSAPRCSGASPTAGRSPDRCVARAAAARSPGAAQCSAHSADAAAANSDPQDLRHLHFGSATTICTTSCGRRLPTLTPRQASKTLPALVSTTRARPNGVNRAFLCTFIEGSLGLTDVGKHQLRLTSTRRETTSTRNRRVHHDDHALRVPHHHPLRRRRAQARRSAPEGPGPEAARSSSPTGASARCRSCTTSRRRTRGARCEGLTRACSATRPRSRSTTAPRPSASTAPTA